MQDRRMIPAIIRFFLDIPGDISTNEKYVPTKCTYTQAGIQDFRVCVWGGGGGGGWGGGTPIYWLYSYICSFGEATASQRPL